MAPTEEDLNELRERVQEFTSKYYVVLWHRVTRASEGQVSNNGFIKGVRFPKKLLRRQMYRMTSPRIYGRNSAKLGNIHVLVLFKLFAEITGC